MKQYKIYTSPLGMTEAVKQGWSWPAFFFTAIWALVKKMWTLGIGLFAAFFVLGFVIGLSGMEESAGNSIINVLSLIMAIVAGAQGNTWREQNLVSRGFKLVGTVSAANPEGAKALHLAPQG